MSLYLPGKNAELDFYESKYTPEQIENSIGKGPIIQNSTWWVWDVAAGAYVDTGVYATPGPGSIVTDMLADSAVTWPKLAPTARRINRNLLDNAYFVGGGSQLGSGIFPINQRGLTSYTGKGYSIDRWFSSNSRSVFTVLNKNVRLATNGAGTSFFRQYTEKACKPGTILTVSALVRGTASGYVGFMMMDAGYSEELAPGETYRTNFHASVDWQLVSFTGVVQDDAHPHPCVIIRNDNIPTDGYVDIAAMKLELGPVQTLAHEDADGNWVLNDTPPNYQEELAKCQYYQSVITAKAGNVTLGTGILNSDHNILLAMPVGPLRTAPANSDNPVGVVCSTDIFAEDVRLPITAIGFLGYHPGDKFITMHLACPTGTVGQIYRVGLLQGNKLIIDSNL